MRNTHIYSTTRAVTEIIRFRGIYGEEYPSHDTPLARPAANYIFRGGVKAFKAHLAALNAEHGAGYAIIQKTL